MTAAVVYRTVIDCVPDRDLSANSNAHYMVRGRKRRALREFAKYQTRDDAPPEPFDVPVRVTISIGWPKGRKRQDQTNVEFCLKSVIDGMTDAGWWTNDKLVTIDTIYQRTWSEWQEQGGWLHPHGCVTLEVKEVTA